MSILATEFDVKMQQKVKFSHSELGSFFIQVGPYGLAK
jgi:hypothetical protein